MLLGILSLIGACLCWSLVFLIPLLLKDFSALEISLARFFSYGLISFGSLVFFKPKTLKKHPMTLWGKSALYGLSATLICFTSMVISVRLADPAACALIYSLSPITIALYGNMKIKTFSYRSLSLPLILIALGVGFCNIKAINFPKEELFTYLLGCFFGFIGLFSWTWYAVSNAHFLKNQSEIQSREWSLMMGSSVFILVIALSTVLSPVISWHWTSQFVIGTAILGVIATWVAFLLWNYGTSKVPVAIAGQLVVLEVIFGLALSYGYFRSWPHSFEMIGASMMLLGVLWSFKLLKKQPSDLV